MTDVSRDDEQRSRERQPDGGADEQKREGGFESRDDEQRSGERQTSREHEHEREREDEKRDRELEYEREGEHEKRDRQIAELLQELRVALPGVQILFAFLLTVPFSQGFPRLTAFGRDVYYFTLITTALSTTCLIAPSASHRLRFHQGDRSWVVESANRLTIAGLGFLALALSGSVLLITDLLFDGARVWIYSGAVWIAILTLWFVRPISRTVRGVASGPRPRGLSRRADDRPGARG